MQCPSCGRENPEHPQVCASCGYDPTVPYEPATSKASRAAVVSFILAILSFFTFLITAIPAIVFAYKALILIIRSPDRLRGKRLAVAAIVIAALAITIVPAVLYSFWRLDAPPIPNDYAISNLRSAPPDCADSFELLKSLCEKDRGFPDAPTVGLNQNDIAVLDKMSLAFQKANQPEITAALKDNATGIKQAWHHARKGRDIINKLTTFLEIADLSEPDLYGGVNLLGNFKRMAVLYRCHASVQANEGDDGTAVSELVEMDSVVRKLSVNARSLITKWLCWGYMAAGIETANCIANNPNTSEPSLRLLAQHFTPVAEEQLSLRSVLIFDYLTFKHTLDTRFEEITESSRYVLKRNSTLRLYRNSCDEVIGYVEGATQPIRQPYFVWPSAYPSFMPDVRIDGDVQPWESRLYRSYNPGGCLMFGVLTRDWHGTITLMTDLRIHDDLLQIVLNKRLGKEVSLKAPAYGDEYIVDVEGKKIFSPGPDGKIDTKDDIKLPINPEVLGWDN